MASALRAKLSKQAKRKTVELHVEGEPVQVEIRELTLAQKAALFAAAGGQDDDGNPKDLERFTVLLVAKSTYEPGTTKRVWSDGEVGEIAGAGPWIDDLEKACLELLGEAPETAPGKSEPTPSSEPGSS